ncbi:hypothetical protein HDU93_002853 [Gonapodya sp. JEL0774]|nr:hypothetical protein HDU93_002853 [Gonapodya sp. JEL0774]
MADAAARFKGAQAGFENTVLSLGTELAAANSKLIDRSANAIAPPKTISALQHAVVDMYGQLSNPSRICSDNPRPMIAEDFRRRVENLVAERTSLEDNLRTFEENVRAAQAIADPQILILMSKSEVLNKSLDVHPADSDQTKNNLVEAEARATKHKSDLVALQTEQNDLVQELGSRENEVKGLRSELARRREEVQKTNRDLFNAQNDLVREQRKGNEKRLKRIRDEESRIPELHHQHAAQEKDILIRDSLSVVTEGDSRETELLWRERQSPIQSTEALLRMKESKTKVRDLQLKEKEFLLRKRDSVIAERDSALAYSGIHICN